MIIKASSITNLTDARYFAAKEVDYLGFNLEEGTEHYLDPMFMKAIREWVQGPKITGEFVRTNTRTVLEAASFYQLDAVQVDLRDDLSHLDGLDVILTVPVVPDSGVMADMLEKAAPWTTLFLLDFSPIPDAAGLLLAQAADWKALFERYPTLLDLPAPADALGHLLDSLQPAGLALRGGDEEQTGVKSFEEIDAVFDLLEG